MEWPVDYAEAGHSRDAWTGDGGRVVAALQHHPWWNQSSHGGEVWAVQLGAAAAAGGSRDGSCGSDSAAEALHLGHGACAIAAPPARAC